MPRPTRCRSASASPADAAALVGAPTRCRAETAAPLDADHAETYDAGGAGRWRAGRAIAAAAAARDFDDDDRGIDDMAERPRSRCASISASSCGSSFADPVDRMIGAHLIALLDALPAG